MADVAVQRITPSQLLGLVVADLARAHARMTGQAAPARSAAMSDIALLQRAAHDLAEVIDSVVKA